MTDNHSDLHIPEHVGIIMDGNGRWAKKRALPRSVGHKYGAQNFRKITRYISKQGVKVLTLYAFSTENWKRPADEVGALMKLFRQYLVDSLTDFREDDIKVVFIGDRSAFDPKLIELINESEEVAKDRKGMLLNIAMNYGSRDEILRAVKMIGRDIRDHKLDPDQITEEDISSRLYTAHLPDPDLIIRTGGEFRLSNFMLYQSAYSEFYSTETLWPDFHEDDFDKAVMEFNRRNRRFGGV
ncbi:MAG: isoprenyl transferase [Clostridia bacterium]|nr:isoprenyl transferase [Clostridia bacterium]